MGRDPSLFLSPLEPPEPEPDPDDTSADSSPSVAHGPGGGRRGNRLVAVSVAVAVLLAGGVAANRIGAGRDPVAQPGPTTTEVRRTPDRPPRATTSTLPVALTTIERRGPMLPEPTGTTLVLASTERLVVAELDTGTVRASAVPGMEVWGGAPFAAILPIGDELLIRGSEPHLVERGPGGQGRPAGPPIPGGLLPSAVEGRWWTVDHRFDVELVERHAGGETGRRLSLPGDSGTVLPFGDGFMISPAGSVLAVDATTGLARRVADGSAVAVDDRTLVRSRCDEALECGLVLSDLDGGRERVIGIPTPRSRYETYSGIRFSPDGRWLVAPFYGEDQPGGLVLIDVERGERRSMDYLTTASRGGFPVTGAFTADSRWLLVSDPTEADRPIKALRIEDGASADIDLGVDGRSGEGGTAMVALPSIPGDVDG